MTRIKFKTSSKTKAGKKGETYRLEDGYEDSYPSGKIRSKTAETGMENERAPLCSQTRMRAHRHGRETEGSVTESLFCQINIA